MTLSEQKSQREKGRSEVGACPKWHVSLTPPLRDGIQGCVASPSQSWRLGVAGHSTWGKLKRMLPAGSELTSHKDWIK